MGDGQFGSDQVVTVSNDTTAIVRNTGTGQDIRLEEHDAAVSCVAVFPKGGKAVRSGR